MGASMMAMIRGLLALLALWAVPAHAQVAPVPHPIGPPVHIAPELVAEQAAVPGQDVTLALVFRPDPGWHGYWSNPGDAGYGMRLEWTLPEGASVAVAVHGLGVAAVSGAASAMAVRAKSFFI